MKYIVNYVDGVTEEIIADADTIIHGVMIFTGEGPSMVIPLHNIRMVTVFEEE